MHVTGARLQPGKEERQRGEEEAALEQRDALSPSESNWPRVAPTQRWRTTTRGGENDLSMSHESYWLDNGVSFRPVATARGEIQRMPECGMIR